MRTWPEHPVIYEINTWVWLGELSRKYNQPMTLAKVPEQEWDQIALLGFDAIWFMGVWERSPAGIAISMRNPGLLEDFRKALPDFGAADNVGSPYCVRRYVVDKHLGGPEGLAMARKALANRRLRLILDFVPNHVAPDHPWVSDHPEYFVLGNGDDAHNDPDSFIEVEGKVFACGRDPFFPAWPDVLQLNAFQPGLRQAVIETINKISDQCDGVRCDMAMLVMNAVFERTWGKRSGQCPSTEYWVDLISAIKKSRPDFLFMAEAYWGLEWELQEQGFDYCYDKRLYDRLEKETAESVRLHLCADPVYQEKMVRFIENHDEPRALSAFSSQKARAAAVTIATVPGAKLFHEGQLEGRKVKLPVFLGRRPVEPLDTDLHFFYKTLLKAASTEGLHQGEWRLCEATGWPDNTSCQNLIAWCWLNDRERYLIVVNLSGSGAQAQIRVPWEDIKGSMWQLNDLFTQAVYERNGDEIWHPGLYVDLPEWGFHFFKISRE